MHLRSENAISPLPPLLMPAAYTREVTLASPGGGGILLGLPDSSDAARMLKMPLRRSRLLHNRLLSASAAQGEGLLFEGGLFFTGAG